MKENTNTNSSLALTIRKENSLVVIQQIALESVRISKKVVFAVLSLTLLNMIV